MSDATDKLARSRQAILEHVARRQRHHDPRMETAQGFTEPGAPPYEDEEPPEPGSGWLGHFMHAVRTWWRYARWSRICPPRPNRGCRIRTGRKPLRPGAWSMIIFD